MPAKKLTHQQVTKLYGQVVKTQQNDAQIKVQAKLPTLVLIILILIGGVLLYTGFDTYHNSQLEEEEERKQGLSCLIQYNNQKCSIASENPDCLKLMDCIEQIGYNPSILEMLGEFLKSSSETINQNFTGPLLIMVVIFGIYFFQKQP